MCRPLPRDVLASLLVGSLVVALCATAASAQVAPTGSHYAGRSTDTGFSSVSSNGGYAAGVPIELEPARDGIPIPLGLSYGARGVGAAGLGWDVPLSYVRREATVAHRRPKSLPNETLAARDRVTVSIGGAPTEMVEVATNLWRARRDAPDLQLSQNATGWVLLDGNGRRYEFTQPEGLVGTNGLWLLTRIGSAGQANELRLRYDVRLHFAAVGFTTSIDLVGLDYNTHGTFAACWKDRVTLTYGAEAAEPLAFHLLGNVPLVRKRTLTSIDVARRAACDSTGPFDPGSLARIRRYDLTYLVDADTGLPRLDAVAMRGRAGTAEESKVIPIARYRYGGAGSDTVVRYGRGVDIALPAALTGTPPIASTVVEESDDLWAHVSWQGLLDLTGDARPDFVFADTSGKLWIAVNVPGGGMSSLFAPPLQLASPAFPGGPLAISWSTQARYGEFWENHDHTWRQTIDVNGDGRLDLVDARQEADTWTIYLNTPGAPITWVEKSFDVRALRSELEQHGHRIEGDYVPLARRTTSFDLAGAECWKWTVDDGWQFVPAFGDERCFAPHEDLGPADQHKQSAEQTYTEWELRDVNGDGYPDAVFNSSPVRHDLTGPSFTPQSEPFFHTFDQVIRRVGPSQGFDNQVLAMLNVVGVRIGTSTAPFARSFGLVWSECGVGKWDDNEGLTANTGPIPDTQPDHQRLMCGLEEVNGDGLVDYVRHRTVYLGTGTSIGTLLALTLPEPIVQFNPHETACAADPDDTYSPQLLGAFRDLTGDGVPDYVTRTVEAFGHGPWQLWTGTGTGFVGPRALVVDSPKGFAVANTREDCAGAFSQTMGGLYDVDGDGKAEVVHILHGPTHLEVFHVNGDGAPYAGRLTAIENGFGAITAITYKSAKEDATTAHQVPFPEIVVTAVDTTGTLGLGGTLHAVRYAYGDAAQVYDPMADAFVLPAYGRSVEVRGVGRAGLEAETAILTDTLDLPAFVPGSTDAVRYDRYAQAGRVRDVTILGKGVPRDPWALLAVDTATDVRRTGAERRAWKSTFVPGATLPAADDDCVDIPDPYAWDPDADNTFSTCMWRGFGFASSVETWTGTAAPPSAANLQTRSEILAVDGHGRVLSVRHENDRFRSEDDICIETTYAEPTGAAFIYTRPATRQINDCVGGTRRATLASESWRYDGLPAGSVGLGRTTAHVIERRRTDNGDLLATIEDATMTYDALGNPTSVTSVRDDGAIRTASLTYDGFGLATLGMTAEATGAATVETVVQRDPVTLAAIAQRDANGTTWGTDLDGFGRPTRSTVTPPGGAQVIMSTTTYTGFYGGKREVRTETFAEAGDTKGSVATAFLDELGRAFRAEQVLGTDYKETLVVLARTYDGNGRVTYEADPFPLAQDAATAYGTSYYYRSDGTLDCQVRGAGVQPYTSSTNLAGEVLPACVDRVFADHAVHVSVRGPDALLGGTPQFDMTHIDMKSAIGQVLARATTQGGARFELETFGYDRLGNLTRLTRFRDPAAGALPVDWFFAYDSLGQTLQTTEPEAAPRAYTYSTFGELRSVQWLDTTVTPPATFRLEKTYDGGGRLTQSVEKRNGAAVAGTQLEWSYDTGLTGPLLTATNTLGRLTRTHSDIGDVHLSYDAFGRANARVLVDPTGETYVEGMTYQLDGNLAELTLALSDTGYATERYYYDYDTASRLRAVTYDGGSESEQLFAAEQIDPWGRVRAARYGAAIEYRAIYEDLGRRLPKEERVSNEAGKRRITGHLGYDAVGREVLRGETRDNQTSKTTSYAYDALGRLTGTKEMTGAVPTLKTLYSYDPLGNLQLLDDSAGTDDASMTYGTIDRDRMCRISYGAVTVGQCNVRYDGSGNIVQQALTGGGSRALAYYPSGAIRAIVQGTTSATWRYDGSGALGELDVAGATAQDKRRDRRYGHVLRRDVTIGGETASILVRDIPGAGASRRGAGGPWIFPFAEARGTRFTADNDGAFRQDISYLPYGEATSTGATPGAPAYTSDQWNGGDLLHDLGVVSVGARIYDPVVGRFLSRDPLIIPRTASTTNPYAFAHNDPINKSDPSGLDPVPGLSIHCTAGTSCIGDGSSSSGSGGGSPWELTLESIGAYLFGDGAPAGPAAPTVMSADEMKALALGATYRAVAIELGYTASNFDFENAVRRGDSWDIIQDSLDAGGAGDAAVDAYNSTGVVGAASGLASGIRSVRGAVTGAVTSAAGAAAAAFLITAKAGSAITAVGGAATRLVSDLVWDWTFGGGDDLIDDLADEGLQEVGYRGAGMNASPRHHIFPQQYRTFFEARGFVGPRSIDQYTVMLEEAYHQAIHGGGNWRLGLDWEGSWNHEVMTRIFSAEHKLGRRLVFDEVMLIGDKLATDYGLGELPWEAYW
jgi:RHS repeat-associated protein